MKWMTYATRGWKKLQKEYIKDDLRSLRQQNLHALLTQDLSVCSFEEMTIHYTAISFQAMHYSVAGYMQTNTLDHAEQYFCLSALAKSTANALLLRSPRGAFPQMRELPMENLAAAILCGRLSAALDHLQTLRTALDREQAPMKNGRPDTRIDRDQERRRKQRLKLEIDFYSGLLQRDDTQAEQALQTLDSLYEFPLLQTFHALFDGDGPAIKDALMGHMKSFRASPDAGELCYLVLFLEALHQRRGGTPLLDLADAPLALLQLPAARPAQLSDTLGLPLPTFEVSQLLRSIDPDKVGPAFMQM